MNLVVFLTIASAAVCARSNDTDIQYRNWRIYNENDRFFYSPGDDGRAYLVDTEEPIEEDVINNLSHKQFRNRYWLYTRSNPEIEQVLRLGNKRSVRRSNFDSSKYTVFIAHGWHGDGYKEMNTLLTKEFLNYTDCNVIVLDWSNLAKRNYATSRRATPRVGMRLGRFIYWLSNNFDMLLSNVHLVGHGLGGHLVGNAGKNINRLSDQLVARITALDPAGPLWYRDRNHRVAKTDATYVEVIHTNAFKSGYPYPTGHTDFYPNGGKHMVGCSKWDTVCSHARSWRYMAASIIYRNFRGYRCKDLDEAFNNQCNGSYLEMGETELICTLRGIYGVHTEADWPYE